MDLSMPRKFKSLFALLVLGVCVSTGAQIRINILWIGNSLEQSPWCGNEGWLATQVMANAIKAQTGLELACYPANAGATPLSRHWTQQDGFAQLSNPVVRMPSDIYATESVDAYDYLVLQTYTHSGVSTAQAESIAICLYADKALAQGTKPVIWACWDDTAKFNSLNPTFVNCYNKYKSQGALLAPLYEIYKSIDQEKPVTYLYVSGDSYHHETEFGVFINISVCNYLFTGVLPSTYNFSLLPTCSEATPVAADKDYLASKAEIALAKYYDLSNAGVRIVTTKLKKAVTGIAYADTMQAAFGKTPYTWSVTAGSLPAGIAMTSAGIISGTSTVAPGSYNFTVQLADAGAVTISKALQLTLDAPRTPENPSGTTAGLSYKYCEGSWSNLPNFSQLNAAKTGVCTAFELSMRNRDTAYGIRYTGYLDVPTEGGYTFYTASDDGSRLYIGTDTIVKNDGVHAMLETSGQIFLKAGKHALAVEFFQGAGGQDLTVSWLGPGIAKAVIPSSRLFTVQGASSAMQNTTRESRPCFVSGIFTLAQLTAKLAGYGALQGACLINSRGEFAALSHGTHGQARVRSGSYIVKTNAPGALFIGTVIIVE
jgi:hypothetical protein